VLSEEQILERLKISGALLQGHFKLASGEHTDRYIECARVLQYPWHATKLCGELASRYQDEKIDLVLGLALGGIIVAFEIARILEIPAVFAEKTNDTMVLRRGFSIRPGQRVLIAEDEIVTGKSVKEVIRLIKDRGGEIVGITALLDRSGGLAQNLGYPLEALVELEAKIYKPEKCPLCRKEIPISKPGERNF